MFFAAGPFALPLAPRFGNRRPTEAINTFFVTNGGIGPAPGHDPSAPPVPTPEEYEAQAPPPVQMLAPGDVRTGRGLPWQPYFRSFYAPPAFIGG